MRRARVGRLIPGAPLLGFDALFDGAYGRASTPRPYPVVRPSRVGSALLPFGCPHCARPVPELVDPDQRDQYRDPVRGHSWCPGCRRRLRVDLRGAPLAGPVVAGVAPARVEHAPRRAARPSGGGLEALGALTIY